jgi:hypothetical protein
MTNLVTEPGLYKIIIRSNKEEAQPFQDWLCEEVLPSIRKTGEYKMKEEYLKIIEENKQIKLEKEKVEQEKEKVEQEKEKVEEEKKELNITVKNLNKKLEIRSKRKNKKGYSVYCMSNPDLPGFKIGESQDMDNREGQYVFAAPKPYIVEHQVLVPEKSNQKSIEDLVLTIFDPFRLKEDYTYSKKREWIDGIDLEKIKTEMNDIAEYLNNKILQYNPEYKLEKEEKIVIEENKEPTKKCIRCNEEKYLMLFIEEQKMKMDMNVYVKLVI